MHVHDILLDISMRLNDEILNSDNSEITEADRKFVRVLVNLIDLYLDKVLDRH